MFWNLCQNTCAKLFSDDDISSNNVPEHFEVWLGLEPFCCLVCNNFCLNDTVIALAACVVLNTCKEYNALIFILCRPRRFWVRSSHTTHCTPLTQCLRFVQKSEKLWLRLGKRHSSKLKENKMSTFYLHVLHHVYI